MDHSFCKGKNIFVTGGTGFFGKWLLETFIYLNEIHQLDIKVTALTRSVENFKREHPSLFGHSNFTFTEGDIRSFSYPKENFDLIIHAATEASAELNKSNPSLMRSTIMGGTKRICEFAKKIECRRILFTSSGAAYGPQPENMSYMLESFMDNPQFNCDDAYASSKLQSEEYFTKHAHCDVVIARCFSFAGPYLPLNGSYAFGSFINDVLNGRDIEIKSDGSAVRSYLYAADLVVWLLRIASKGIDREIYNVGSSKAINIKDLAESISGGKVKVNVLGVNQGDKNIYVPDISKAKKELGLKEYTSLDSAISKTIAFNTH
jgi:dTDP-glucose 4,6-dehydratase